MTIRWGTWLAGSALVVAVSACGGGSSGTPTSLSLEGLKVPTSDVVSAVKSMCGVAAQAHTDPVASNSAYYGGPQAMLHRLAAILASNHSAESKALLTALGAYETDVTHTPPSATAGTDADAIVQASDAGLKALKVTPPPC